MRSHDTARLKDELKLAGASPAEMPALLSIISRLEKLGRSRPGGVDMPGQTSRIAWLLKPLGVGAAGLAAGLLLVVASQSVLPTSWLFPVQKATDAVAMAVHPQYRAAVMMKRADQVNALVANHADSRHILAALNGYTAVARSYESVSHPDYAAFQYCKSMLTQAAQEAAPRITQAIQASLDSLDTT